jgi:hypothetical protein
MLYYKEKYARVRGKKKAGHSGSSSMDVDASNHPYGLFDQVLLITLENKQEEYDHSSVKALMAKKRRLRAEQELVRFYSKLAELQHDICTIDCN